MFNWFKKRQAPLSGEKNEIELKDLGNQCFGAGRLEEAANYYRLAIQIKPDYAEAHCNLGAVYESQARLNDAVMEYRSALAYNPELLPALRNVGLTLIKLERLIEAKKAFQDILLIDPKNIIALENLCLISMTNCDLADANAYFSSLIALQPNDLRSFNSWALFLKENGKTDEAESLFHRALAVSPGDSDTLYNLGTTYLESKRFSEAENTFRESLIEGTNPEKIRFSLSYLLLMTGRFREGWREFENRWEGAVPPMPRPFFPVPRWEGQAALEGESLLIFAEHGLGDMIQFSRFLPIAQARFGGRVSVLVPSLYGSLKSLLQTSFPDIEFIDAYSEKDFSWHWYSPVLSLPNVLNQDEHDISVVRSYLRPDIMRIHAWKIKMDGLNLPTSTRKIGIVWQTGKRMKNAPLRSLSLQQISPLLNLASCSWFSLQKEPDPDAAVWVGNGKIIDWSAEFKDFHDTAALAMNLDLIISVDTSVVHLAGALGRPTWLFNRYASEWRWMYDREDSPWYPTMRIFNQKNEGDWDDVVEQMRCALMSDLPN